MSKVKQQDPRLRLVEAPEDPIARQLFDQLAAGRGILNLHRMMAHAPELMRASSDMAVALRTRTRLARPLAELVIMRTAQVMDCGYVFDRHLPLARACGVAERQIAELAQWRTSAAFTFAQKTALDFAVRVAARGPVDAAIFAALRRHFSPQEIVEITMLIGHYVGTAMLINALGVPPEER